MIRVAGREDVADVVRLLLEFAEWFGKPADREQFEHAVSSLVGSSDTEYLLGGDGGSPVAVAQVRYRLSVWTGVEDCWLEDLFVSEAARGSGLGREMVSEVGAGSVRVARVPRQGPGRHVVPAAVALVSG